MGCGCRVYFDSALLCSAWRKELISSFLPCSFPVSFMGVDTYKLALGVFFTLGGSVVHF
jgi:hypothetical protein